MNAQELSNEILSDIEKDKITAFCEDKTMFNAVEKFVLAVCYRQGVVDKGGEHVPTRNWAMNLAWGAINPNGMPRTDEELGQNLRALTYAVQLIGSGFKEMQDIREVKEVEKDEINEGE